ncbi:MAG: glycoside hydrolase family 127 protein, partial [Treponema sp.]|nr:glycoside hydrolase family 127 protein [Treponema sp.]
MDTSNHSEFIPLTKVRVKDPFWTPFMERIRTRVIPYQWEALNDRVPGAEPSYCMRNFKLAAQLSRPGLDYGADSGAGHGGNVFQDSDFAKWIEAAACTLAWHPDPELEETLDGAIDIICKAQQADGYLNTYYIINGLDKRFTNLRNNHELYCFGHFLEAAAAYYEVTGKRKLLDALIRYADCIDRHIGPEEGKLHGYPGHEVAEMALVKLYAITKDEKHLRLARYFIDERGRQPLFFEEETLRNGSDFYWKDSYYRYQYYQAGKPVR